MRESRFTGGSVVSRRHPLRAAKKAVYVTAAVSIAVFGFSIGVANAAQKPRALANVTVGVPTTSILNLPLWVAQSDGYYAAKNLNVKITTLAVATATAALLSNSVTFDDDGSTAFIQARVQNDPVEAVEGLSLGLPLGLIISNSFAASHGITAKTPLATVAKDFVGSTGGSSAASTTGDVAVFLRSYGVQTSQYTVASLANTAADQAALENNEINWFCTSEPTSFQTQSLGYGIVVASPKNVPAWGEHQVGLQQVVVATDAFADANPGLVREFVSANQEATIEIAKHEQQVLPIAQANSPGVSRPLLLKSYALLGWPLTAKMNVNEWRTALAFDIKGGQVNRGTKITENVDWTNKFA